MIRNVNGININGSPGGTMSQSISTPISDPFGVYSYTDTTIDPVDTYYVIGKSRFERQWLDNGGVLNLRVNLTQTVSLGWTYSVGIFWATQSANTFNASSLPSGMVQLASNDTNGTFTHVPLARSIYFSGSTFSVLSPNYNIYSDLGDPTSGSISSVTLPSGDGYFLVAAYNPQPLYGGRLQDSIRFHYMLIDTIYNPVLIGSNYHHKSNLLIGRNNVALTKTKPLGFFNNGTSHTGSTTNTIIGYLTMTDFIADGDFFRFETRCYKTGGVGTYTIRYYYNTSISLTGANQLSTRGIAAINLYHRYSRGIYVYSANGTGNGSELISTGGSYASEFAGPSNEPYTHSNVLVDWTASPCYIICAVQLGNAADTVTCEYLSVTAY